MRLGPAQEKPGRVPGLMMRLGSLQCKQLLLRCGGRRGRDREVFGPFLKNTKQEIPH